MAVGAVGSSIKGAFTQQQLEYLDQLEKASKTDKLKLNQDMGKDQFLHILLTQLSNQNPMDPLQDKDFIAQMAQFSSLENMQAMNDTFSEVKLDLGDIKYLMMNQASVNPSELQTQVLNKISTSLESMEKIQAEQLEKLNQILSQNNAALAYE